MVDVLLWTAALRIGYCGWARPVAATGIGVVEWMASVCVELTIPGFRITFGFFVRGKEENPGRNVLV